MSLRSQAAIFASASPSGPSPGSGGSCAAAVSSSIVRGRWRASNLRHSHLSSGGRMASWRKVTLRGCWTWLASPYSLGKLQR